MKSIPSTILLISLVAMASGCSSLGYKKAQDTSSSLRETAQSIEDSIPPLDAVIVALGDLAQTPNENIVNQYQSYRSALSELESSIGLINSRAQDMQLLGDAYFLNWEGELAKIRSYDIATDSRDRKAIVSKKFNSLSKSYVSLNQSLVPFMSDLADIRTVLGTDLTKNGLKSVEDSLKKANRDGARIRNSLSGLSEGFRDLGIEMGTSSSATAYAQ
ncbi:DUF2959 family protein [Pelagicoccus sp. SDUM812003]|uniref:DUF2959 family protein n=1 Tax=Pelagicoccus sp. SDUM812003 TaxID=3041267 RepID=UPI00281012E9|nr:DUF2959 family protein [Pelagicoccus sp. SDUM812003]MDQ8204718.1 DUF2959 family protein [Pelagicoccus sp. SDUM812003]